MQYCKCIRFSTKQDMLEVDGEWRFICQTCNFIDNPEEKGGYVMPTIEIQKFGAFGLYKRMGQLTRSPALNASAASFMVIADHRDGDDGDDGEKN